MPKTKPQASFYNQILQKHISPNIEALDIRNMEGGCINNAQKINTIKGDYFIKWNANVPLDFFEKEALGLQLLKSKNIFTIPEVIGFGEFDSIKYLLMEYIKPEKKNPKFWQDFGEKLARLHQIHDSSFGLSFHNYLGSIPQDNTFTNNWIDFFIEKRLKVNIKIANNKKLINNNINDKFESLFLILDSLLNKEVKPSLLHGDLWNGNFIIDNQGSVCLLDPAVYFGDKEMEMAFVKLFGGFEKPFFDAYYQNQKNDKSLEERILIYQLYPLLVHLNLFGVEYLAPINSILKKFVSK